MSLPSTAASSSLDKPAAATTDDCRSASVYDGAPSFEAIIRADAKGQEDRRDHRVRLRVTNEEEKIKKNWYK